MVLFPLIGGVEPDVTIRLVITIARNLADAHENDNAASAETRAINHPANSMLPTRETSHPAPHSASIRTLTFQAMDETEIATVSENLTQSNTPIAQATPRPVANEASVVAGAVTGLAYAVLNLAEMVNIINLRADVSESRRPFTFI